MGSVRERKGRFTALYRTGGPPSGVRLTPAAPAGGPGTLRLRISRTVLAAPRAVTSGRTVRLPGATAAKRPAPGKPPAQAACPKLLG